MVMHLQTMSNSRKKYRPIAKRVHLSKFEKCSYFMLTFQKLCFIFKCQISKFQLTFFKSGKEHSLCNTFVYWLTLFASASGHWLIFESIKMKILILFENLNWNHIILSNFPLFFLQLYAHTLEIFNWVIWLVILEIYTIEGQGWTGWVITLIALCW